MGRVVQPTMTDSIAVRGARVSIAFLLLAAGLAGSGAAICPRCNEVTVSVYTPPDWPWQLYDPWFAWVEAHGIISNPACTNTGVACSEQLREGAAGAMLNVTATPDAIVFDGMLNVSPPAPADPSGLLAPLQPCGTASALCQLPWGAVEKESIAQAKACGEPEQIITVVTTSATFYIEDRSTSLGGTDQWVYLESNGKPGVQHGGSGPADPVLRATGLTYDTDACTDAGEPDTLLF
jgi:hypothetical protein